MYPIQCPGLARCWLRCACGICGSDLHVAAHGGEMLADAGQLTAQLGAPDVDLNNDVFMGHEFSAKVLQASPGTRTPQPGTLTEPMTVGLHAVNESAIRPDERRWCRVADLSASRLSLRSASVVAWKPLWEMTIRRCGVRCR